MMVISVCIVKKSPVKITILLYYFLAFFAPLIRLLLKNVVIGVDCPAKWVMFPPFFGGSAGTNKKGLCKLGLKSAKPGNSYGVK